MELHDYSPDNIRVIRDQIMEVELDRAYGMRGRIELRAAFWWENVNERPLGRRSKDGIILKLLT
jgi:hypothetical protein